MTGDPKLDTILAFLVSPLVLSIVALVAIGVYLSVRAERVIDRAAERVWPTPRVLRGERR